MNNFERPQNTPSQEPTVPPFDFDAIDFDAIRDQVLAERPFGTVAKAPESHDFSETGAMSAADNKALSREDITRKFTAANDQNEETKLAA